MTSAADRKRAQRDRARERGLCSSCCRRKARKGKAYCKACATASYERVKANREKST